MADISFTKYEIAECQLIRALRLFFEDKDYISVITLAGASDEIIGQLIETNGGHSTYSSRKNAFERVHQYFYGEPPQKKAYNELVNGVRNGLKHYIDGEPMVFDPEQEAINILDSAVTNYFHLTGNETEEMLRFTNYHKGLHIKF